MWIQKQAKVKVFGAAMILAVMFVCSIAAFAAITSSTTSIQFPSEAVGATSAPMSVTISNTSKQSMVIESASVSTAQFTYSGPAFPITLADGQSFTGSVTFTPAAAKAYSGTLKFGRRGVATLVSVNLSGTGTAAAQKSPYVLAPTPSSFAFSGVAGSSPACQSLRMIDTTPGGPVPVTLNTDVSWLSVTPTSGETNFNISVCVNTTGVASGTLTGHIIATATGANPAGQTVNNSPYSIPVTLVVTAAAQTHALTASSTALSFSAQVGAAAPASQSLTIGDSPASALPFTVTADQTWINLSAASGTTSSVIQVGANISGLAAGSYSGHVIVSATGATNSPMSIPVTLVVAAAAQTHALTASSSAVSFSATAGGTAPAAQSLTIGDTPASVLPFTVTADQTWINLSAASGTTSSAIQVGANIGGLAAGSYSGHVIVSATGVTNSPMSIPVTLVVAAGTPSPYMLVATPTSLAFTGAVGSTPVCQSLTIDDTTPGGPLPVVLSSDSSWLTVTPASGNTKVVTSVCVKTTGLAAGSKAGHIIVTATGPNTVGQTVNNSPMSIPVTLVIAGAQASTLTATPSAMSFSAVAGGLAPALQSLTIGETPAGVVPFTVTADQAWMTLSAASGTTSSAIQVGANISGLAAGNYTGHVITTAAGMTNSPMSVTVTLAVTAAQTSLLSVNPTSVAFGSINLGNNNTKTVTVTNSGTGSVTISSVSVAGAGMSANGIATPMTLTAGQTTVLSIVFAPTAVGAVSGTVSVVSNATNSPAVITTTGTGAQPQLTASPALLSFGNVAVGSSGTKTITLSNAGTAAVTISQTVVSGTGYTMSGLAMPMTLAAGASTSFSVQFAPTSAGSDSGSVTVTSNTPNSPTMVATSGTGTAQVVHSVSLSWVASTSSTVVGYNIYRGSVSGGPYTVLNSTPNASMTYTDMAVTAGQKYYYVVTAVDGSGNESVVSNEVSVIVPTP